AHAHSLGLWQPLKLGFPFSFLGRKLEVDVTMDINGAFHHFVIDRHGALSSLTLYGLCSQQLALTEESPFACDAAQDERGAPGKMGSNPFMLSIVEAFLEFFSRTDFVYRFNLFL